MTKLHHRATCAAPFPRRRILLPLWILLAAWATEAGYGAPPPLDPRDLAETLFAARTAGADPNTRVAAYAEVIRKFGTGRLKKQLAPAPYGPLWERARRACYGYAAFEVFQVPQQAEKAAKLRGPRMGSPRGKLAEIEPPRPLPRGINNAGCRFLERGFRFYADVEERGKP